MTSIEKIEEKTESCLLYQYEVPMFKKHTLIDSQTAMMGGRFPSYGYVTILCKNTNKPFNMGYSSQWNEEKSCYDEYEYEYKYCPKCGKLLIKEK